MAKAPQTVEFKDSQGRLWHPKLDLDACERFEQAVGEGFFTLAHRVGVIELAASVRYSVPLAWACVDAEAQRRAVGYTEFRDCLGNGDLLMGVAVTMGHAVREFFPTAGTTKKAARKRARKKPRAVPGNGGTSGDSPASQGSNDRAT